MPTCGRGEPEWSERETYRGYAASVTTLFWVKTQEGLTSHLENFCSASQTMGGCVVGCLESSVALLLWFFSVSRITLCGCDQRYASGWGCGYACRQFLHSKPSPLLYHCVSLWLWVWVLVVYTCSFVLSVSGFAPGKTEELIHIFVPQQKGYKTL